MGVAVLQGLQGVAQNAAAKVLSSPVVQSLVGGGPAAAGGAAQAAAQAAADTMSDAVAGAVKDALLED